MKTEYKAMIAVAVLAIGGLAIAQNFGSDSVKSGTRVDPSQTIPRPQAASPDVSAQRDEFNRGRNADNARSTQGDTAAPSLPPRSEVITPDIARERDSERNRVTNPENTRSTQGEAGNPVPMAPHAEGTTQSGVTEGASRSNRN